MRVTNESKNNTLLVGPLSQDLQNNYTLATTTTPESYEMELVNASGFVAGSLIIVEERLNDEPEIYYGVVLSVATNTLTLDRPIDGVFTSNAIITRENADLSVNGSVTPIVFRYANRFEEPISITRAMFNMVTSTDPDFDEFGNLPALTRGILLRKKNFDGTFTNFPAIKTNNRLQLLMYDVTFFDSGLFATGGGLSGRFTFTKLGNAVKLGKNEELQVLVQDDLTGLVSFEVVVEGNRN